jgi:3-oxoacid CoA-transferase A subunit
MAIDKRVETAAAAVAGVADGATVMISGFGGAGFANALIRALRAAGPRNLTLVVNSATHRLSLTHELIEADMVTKVICSAARGAGTALSPFEQRLKDGRIELVALPQGTLAECIRAGGAGIPAFYTPSGLGTELTRGREIRRFGGRDYVLEEAITADVALVRADTADRFGNLTFRHAQANFGPVMATAAKLTIAEVRMAQHDPIEPARVQLPGVYVNRVFAVGAP